MRTPNKQKRSQIISSKVFVGNLNFKTTSDQIQTAFSEVGEVVEVFLPTDRNTGKPRGFAFVEYSDPASVSEAIKKFDGFELDGRPLRVNEAEDRPPRAPRRPAWSGDAGFSGEGPNIPPARPKGSRRNLRGKKRSL